MGLERIQLYHVLGQLIWKLVRPVVVMVSRRTENSWDDGFVESIDEVMKVEVKQDEIPKG